MKRITEKQLEIRIAEINQIKGLERYDIGALKLYHDICGYAIDKICNAGGGVTRLYGGGETAKNCMWYLNNCID